MCNLLEMLGVIVAIKLFLLMNNFYSSTYACISHIPGRVLHTTGAQRKRVLEP